jgi:ABC-2 type transport system ATP-binding protein
VSVQDSVCAVQVTGARKVFRATPWSMPRVAVEDVTLKVPAGAVHGLLGPNGAGKTTTLKMLIGLTRADAGTFEVLGADSRRPSGRSTLGFLPEQPYFPSQLTGEQAMRLYARLAGVPRNERGTRIARLLERVGLERHGHTRLSAYSRGMLQRLGIAQALVGGPKVVVLDEPASGLDPVGQRDVRSLMLELKGEGVTVLLSSHQLSEIEAVCDRVSILDRGRVAAEGAIEDLLNVAGRMAVRAAGLSAGLPAQIASLTDDAASSGGVWSFSVPDASVRAVVDGIDDSGGSVLSLAPKRESLEDYFARLLERSPGGAGGTA